MFGGWGVYFKRSVSVRRPQALSPEREHEASFGDREGMVCPRCRAGYAFGETCPDCDVQLVGAAFADIETPEPPVWAGRARARAVTVSVFAAVLLAATLTVVFWG